MRPIQKTISVAKMFEIILYLCNQVKNIRITWRVLHNTSTSAWLLAAGGCAQNITSTSG